jgi:intracellular sulfur oxidation DsrE/DsrF family protein
MDRADARMDRFERQLEATRKLVENGVRFVARMAQAHRAQMRDVKLEMRELRTTVREVAASVKDLAKSQKITEQKLQAFIDSLRKRTNGRR